MITILIDGNDYYDYYLVRNKRTGYDLKKPNDFAGGSGGYAP